MPIRLGVPKEIEQSEHRVALVPPVAERFHKLGVELLLETGAADKFVKIFDVATGKIVRSF